MYGPPLVAQLEPARRRPYAILIQAQGVRFTQLDGINALGSPPRSVGSVGRPGAEHRGVL